VPPILLIRWLVSSATVLALWLGLVSAACAATESTPLGTADAKSGRPRVGLVLSGGGARGFAHIGILRVLEAMRVPIDCIAGTSMGALVGGSYAAGVSPEEMESRLGRIDWTDLLRDDPGRLEKPYRQRADDFNSLWPLELGVRGGKVQLPAGATSFYKFELFLRDMISLGGGVTVAQFDELTVPFRALATNLETGEAKVFDRGDLPRIMRASMSVPGLFTPVDIDGQLYVDGGLTRNLPVNVARRTCADVVIAVNLGTPLMTREQLTSVVAIAEQSINLMTELNVKQSLASLKDTDVLISPDLTGFSSADFLRFKEAMEIGMKAAEAKRDELERLQVSTAEYDTWREVRESRRQREIEVSEIRVATKTQYVNPQVIKSELAVKPGPGFSAAELDADIKRMYGRGDFDSVTYSLGRGEEGNAVTIRATEKSWGPNYLKFGLGLVTDFQEQRFNMVGSYRRTWINSLGAEWRTDAQIGWTDRLASEFYQPLGFEYIGFVAPRIEIQRQPTQFYRGDQLIGEYQTTYERFHLDLGYQNKQLEGRLGPFVGHLKADSNFGLVPAPNFSLTQAGISGRLVLDQLDNPDFPRNGYLAAARAFSTQKSMGSDDQYSRADVLVTGAASAGTHTFGATASYGTTIAGTLPPYDLYKLGGFLRLSGLRLDQLTGTEYYFGRLVYRYEYDRLPSALGGGLYLGVSAEAGQMNSRFSDLNPDLYGRLLPAGSVFWGADTVLGPVYFSYGYAPSGGSSFYFVLGRP
jgi:NTE family protein